MRVDFYRIPKPRTATDISTGGHLFFLSSPPFTVAFPAQIVGVPWVVAGS